MPGFAVAGSGTNAAKVSLSMYASADLITRLKAIFTDGSGLSVQDEQIRVDTSAANTVDVCAAGEVVCGNIEFCPMFADDATVILLTVGLRQYDDKEGNIHAVANGLSTVSYKSTTGTPTIGQEVQSDGNNYMKGVDSGGGGKITYVDTTNETLTYLS